MNESSILVFDIETIPDVCMLRKLYRFDESVDDASVVAQVCEQLKTERGSDFLPTHLHKVACISAVMRRRDEIKVWSVGELESSEKEILQRFFSGIDRYAPTLVSWNGAGFDLPVLHYRAMHHKLSAPRYWDLGEKDSGFKWNNYISRYHLRHTDLMDVLALYNNRAFVKLDEASILMGFPGKMGMSGGSVWEDYQAGGLKGIRDYCETDVMNTYLIYLRFELMRGLISLDQYEAQILQLKHYLKKEGHRHFLEFLSALEPEAALV